MKSLPYWTGLTVVLMGACVTPPAATEHIEPPTPSARSNPPVQSYALSAKEMDRVRELNVHLAERWFEVRGERLGMSLVDIAARDAKISTTQPPALFWDEQTAEETAAVWSALCNECHGGRRRLADVKGMPPPPRDWGKGTGYFFGKSRSHKRIFAMVSEGGEEIVGPESEMPGWGKRLSREIIWSLVYFIEFQSGGIEGRFPPSLYPTGH